MNLLKIKVPDYLPKASEAVNRAADIIYTLLDRGIAYRHKGNIYFDPNKYPKFGELYGLDMTKWPTKKRRFHKDTYPGMRWNRGDFILWHGHTNNEDVCWDTKIGTGRPSWNIQDPSMIIKYFDQTLSIYCGGIDNLIRHHDYSRAILESIHPYPMAGFWLHCRHLFVNGKKMSKSKGNIYYTDTLLKQGYDIDEIRFFLICSHYRKTLNYSSGNMRKTAQKLKKFKETVSALQRAAGQNPDFDTKAFEKIKKDFAGHMDNDLDVKSAFDSLYKFLCNINIHNISPAVASGFIKALKEIDKVMQVIF
jgi:cysteinyl-tRNA synthetase